MTHSNNSSPHGMWTSRLAFILAATGSTVGLGNIWKFPYVTGENGGGLFVLCYIACVAIIGLPIMMAEVMLGRRGHRNPIDTMRILAFQEKSGRHWVWVGRMGMLAAFLILSYYSVIAGWILAYILHTANGAFVGLDATGVQNLFQDLTQDPERLIAWHTIFMVATVLIVARGLEQGLEKSVRYLMPALFVILLLLFCYAMTTSGFAEGLRFMFVPDLSKFSSDSLLAAMGMAFFSLSLGMGAIMMYGAYLPQDISIARTTMTVVLVDTSVAIIAGMVIFPIVFAYGLAPAQGPGLVFNTLPLAFNQMPFGTWVGILFFVLLTFAAITSAISLLEPPVAWLIENRKIDRKAAASLCGIVSWFLGLGTIFSFNLWQEYRWTFSLDLGKVQYLIFQDKSFFDIIEFITSNIFLPLGGLLIAIFAAHLMQRESSESELALGRHSFNIWYFILRYISPVAVGIILLNSIGIFALF